MCVARGKPCPAWWVSFFSLMFIIYAVHTSSTTSCWSSWLWLWTRHWDTRPILAVISEWCHHRRQRLVDSHLLRFASTRQWSLNMKWCLWSGVPYQMLPRNLQSQHLSLHELQHVTDAVHVASNFTITTRAQCGITFMLPAGSHKLIVDLLTSRACRRKVLFSALAHSMHSRHSSTSCPVAASMSRNRSSRERTSRAALALLMEIRKGLTNFSRPPSSEDRKTHVLAWKHRFRRVGSAAGHRGWTCLPAAWPVLAKSVPNSRMLCSLTLTASSSFSWTSLLTVNGRQHSFTTYSMQFKTNSSWKSWLDCWIILRYCKLSESFMLDAHTNLTTGDSISNCFSEHT